MSPLDSDTLIVRAWPGADHPNPALAAMAALICLQDLKTPEVHRLWALFDRRCGRYLLRRWPHRSPESFRELPMEPEQMDWFRCQLQAVAAGEPWDRWAWIRGRVLQIRQGPADRLLLCHSGLPRPWIGWREALMLTVGEAGRAAALLQSAHTIGAGPPPPAPAHTRPH